MLYYVMLCYVVSCYSMLFVGLGSDVPPNDYDAGLSHGYQLGLAAVTEDNQHILTPTSAAQASTLWKRVTAKDGIEIFHKTEAAPSNDSTGSNTPRSTNQINAWKGIGEINASPEMIIAVFSSLSHRSEWDPRIESARLVQQIDRLTRIQHNIFKVPWPMTPRDSLTVGGIYRVNIKNIRGEEIPSLLMIATSANHPSSPPLATNKRIRAIVLYYAVLVMPISTNDSTKTTTTTTTTPRTRVIWSACVDTKIGTAPQSLLYHAQSDLPLCIARVRNLITNKPDMAQQCLEELLHSKENINNRA